MTVRDVPALNNEEPGVFQNLRQLINIVDELRDVGLQQIINLPRICVVGTQSAGKSSVLEGIVGMDFLPRGEGIVTRRPLELRLVHIAPSRDGLPQPSFAVFDEDPHTKITDFNEVRRRIDEYTNKIAGKNKGIVDDPIVLSVHGTDCPDLTLVDLPGITRVPLKGSDQTDDIERLTRDMAERYAKDTRTVILAVVPANQDISTSDALQLARKVDLNGMRTIGVITKIDLMDRGTNAAKMINGDEVPLRLGFVAVKNRSQQDIGSRKSVKDALEEEREFFRTTPPYNSMPLHQLGTPALIDKLTKVLFKHIRSVLPEIKNEIQVKLRALKQRLMQLGDGVPSDSSERAQFMWTMISDYCALFSNTIRGKYDKRLVHYMDTDPTTQYGGAQIRSVFNSLLQDYTHTGITNDISSTEIDQAIRIHEGDSLPGFPSPDTFEYLILPHLRKIHIPVMDCLDRVASCLELVSQQLGNRVFQRFPALAVQILELTQNILQREKEKTRQILENIVAAETGYLFTNDTKYLTDHGYMLPLSKDGKSNEKLPQTSIGPQAPETGASQTSWLKMSNPNVQPSGGQQGGSGLIGSIQQAATNMWTREKPRTHYSDTFLNEIKLRLDAYFGIVLRNIRDTVPKTIGHFLVRASQEALQFELNTRLNNAEQFDALLGEPQFVREERQAISKQIKILQNASHVLQRDPSIAAISIPDSFDEGFPFQGGDMQRHPHQPSSVTAAMLNTSSSVEHKQQTMNPPPLQQSISAASATGGLGVRSQQAAFLRSDNNQLFGNNPRSHSSATKPLFP